MNKKILNLIIGIFFLGIVILMMILNNKNNQSNTTEFVEAEEFIETTKENHIEENSKKIIIHITGQIKNPGIIEINENSRIINAIEAAGGLTENADLAKVNLAYILHDAQKIYIPSIFDELEENIIINNSGIDIISGSSNEIVKIDINRATQTELEKIPGVGPSTALKIIDYREKNGKFKSIEEIKNISGIGEAKYDLIKNNITV